MVLVSSAYIYLYIYKCSMLYPVECGNKFSTISNYIHSINQLVINSKRDEMEKNCDKSVYQFRHFGHQYYAVISGEQLNHYVAKKVDNRLYAVIRSQQI